MTPPREIRTAESPPARHSRTSPPAGSARSAARARWTSRRGTSSSALLEHDKDVALGDRLPLMAADLGHGPRILRLDGHFHLHRFEDHDRVPLLDRVTD